MLTLSAKIRKILGKKTKTLRKKGIIPAILYGPKIKSLSLEVDSKDFEKIYTQAGESSLISLEVEDKKEKYPVLIYGIQKDALSGRPIHIDFYQPSLKEEVEATVSIIFEGESKACKDLGGTLIKNIQQIKLKALPQELPKEIKVNIEPLQTFEDTILLKDIKLPPAVRILQNPEEIVAWVSPPAKVEEELEKPIEEKVEEVEKIEKEKKEKEEEKEEIIK